MMKAEPYQSHLYEMVIEESAKSSHLGSDWFIETILTVSGIFAAISSIMIIHMVISRIVQNWINEREEALRHRFQDFLSSFLLLPVDESFIGIQQNNRIGIGLELIDLQSNKRRQILAEEIYELLQNIDGLPKRQLVNYFLGIGLQNEVKKWLSSNSIQKVIKAINMIASAELMGFEDHLRFYINNENQDVSIAAIIALIKLDNDLSSLMSITRRLNDWDCHKIYEVVKNDRSKTKMLLEILEMPTMHFQLNLLHMNHFLADQESFQYTL